MYYRKRALNCIIENCQLNTVTIEIFTFIVMMIVMATTVENTDEDRDEVEIMMIQ